MANPAPRITPEALDGVHVFVVLAGVGTVGGAYVAGVYPTREAAEAHVAGVAVPAHHEIDEHVIRGPRA